MVRLKLGFYFLDSEKVVNKSWTPFDDDPQYIWTDRNHSSKCLMKQINSDWAIVNGVHYEYWETFQSFRYKFLYKIICENKETVSLGIGWNNNGKLDLSIGYLEFNPNKVAKTTVFQLVFKMIRSVCRRVEVSRFDLAIDLPVRRSLLGLIKDERKYAYEMMSIEDKTEYLGQRNKHGRVKLYNKKIESELEYDLTRLEITCDGIPDLKTLQNIVPSVTGLSQVRSVDEKLSSTDEVIVELLLKQDDKEVYFKRLGKEKAKKLRPYVLGEHAVFEIPLVVYSHVVEQLQKYVL